MPVPSGYAAALLCCFTLAHLARWAAAILRRADADIVRLPDLIGTGEHSENFTYPEKFLGT